MEPRKQRQSQMLRLSLKQKNQGQFSADLASHTQDVVFTVQSVNNTAGSQEEQ